MADWASLLPELVQSIANCVLFTTTGDVAAYMDMRAVCPSWRSAIAKPSPLAAIADLRFRPQHWVMIDQKSQEDDDIDDYAEDDDTRLFFHALSGRFRRVHLPLLRGRIIHGAGRIIHGVSDGLLVLTNEYDDRDSLVLNPITGDKLHFATTLHDYIQNTVLTSVGGISHSTLVLWWGRGNTLEFAGPTSDVVTKKEEMDTYLSSMVAFQGNVYHVDPEGRVFKIVGPLEKFSHELVAQVSPEQDVCARVKGGEWCTLVESDGELLLVRLSEIDLKVFKVDVERMLLEEIKSLGGNRVLFLGDGRCLSVNSDKLIPSVDGDSCIYVSSVWGRRDACIYNLRDEKMQIIFKDYRLDRPFSLVHVLLKYCEFSYK